MAARGLKICSVRLFQKSRPTLLSSSKRNLSSTRNTDEDEFKFDVLTGDLEGESVEYLLEGAFFAGVGRERVLYPSVFGKMAGERNVRRGEDLYF